MQALMCGRRALWNQKRWETTSPRLCSERKNQSCVWNDVFTCGDLFELFDSVEEG